MTKFNTKTTRYISTSEAANILGVSRVAVVQRINRGEIKAEKIAGRYLIDKKNLSPIFDETNRKAEIKKAIDKVVRDYSEALKKLGRE